MPALKHVLAAIALLLGAALSQTSPASAQEQIMQIQVTPADRAAVALHRRVHTKGALRPEGGHYPPKTFETDSSGALLEVTGVSRSSIQSMPVAASQAVTVTPPFTGPGFFPADLSLVSNSGETITQAQVHNIYINCTASCWGYPAVFEHNLFSSRFIHVLDQYVGSEEDGRYTVGPSLVISNYQYTLQNVTNPMVNYADLDAILHAAASRFGSGYSHIYNIFLPKGVDYCNGYAPPYTFCFSPDNPSTWAECAEHDTDSFSDIPGVEYATVEPYPDVFEIVPVNGVPTPVYPCDVGQPPPFTSDTNPTPNGVLIDAVSDDVGHEIFETITDPDGIEWLAQQGYFGFLSAPPPIGTGAAPAIEIADVCELNNGTAIFTPFYISGHLYEVQPMYSNKYHACVTVP